LNKYGENKWLNRTGSNKDGEWMVSYHGTNKNSMDNVVDEGLKQKFSQKFDHGKGIYSTPDVNIAEK